MTIKNLKISKKVALLLATGTVTLMLSGCNKQVIDLHKTFNVAVEPNGNSISVVGVQSYNDYEGSQVQFYTQSGLVVLSSTHQLQLIDVDSKTKLDTYISYIDNEDDVVSYHDENMGTSINYHPGWNKRVFDFKYMFNKAIILRDDNTASIVNISGWRDYEDDKVQLSLTNGTMLLTEIDKVKIVDDSNALEGALLDYAASLVGSIDNVYYQGRQQQTLKK